MVKKILSLLGVVSMLSTMVVATAFAVPATTLTFELSKSTFDPGDTTANVETVTYHTDASAAPVTMNVKDSTGTVVYTATSTAATVAGAGGLFDGTFAWNGKNTSNHFVKEGAYSVNLDSGTVTATPKTVTIDYKNGLEPNITSLETDLSTIDTDNEDTATISFDLENPVSPSNLVAGIYNSSGTLVFSPDFSGHNTDSNDKISGSFEFEWDGTDTDGVCAIASGDYTVKVTAENEYGFIEVTTKDSVGTAVKITVITPNDTQYKCSKLASKVDVVSLDPNGTWDPIADGKLDINYDVITETDDSWDFEIFAIKKGSTKISLYSESQPETGEETITWDGTDDNGDSADSGTWEIVAVSTFDRDDGITYKYYDKIDIKVAYTKPSIDDAFVTKTVIDPEAGEGVYFAFLLKDDDANVDVGVTKNCSSTTCSTKVDLLEDQKIDAGKWYAVYWDGVDEDGDLFDVDDTFRFLLTAKSLGDDNVEASKLYSIDLADDTTSTSKPNVTKDVLVPPVIATSGDEVTLSYYINSSAEVSVGIYDGTSTSGSPDVELSPYTAQTSGDHSVTWNLEDNDGNSVGKGYYTYKISAKKTGSSSIETETGKFYVGTVGEVFGEPGEKEEPSVVTPTEESCGFVDVSATNPNCAAIKWSKDNGVVLGNSDGTFKAYSPINRAEVLATILRAFDLGLFADDGTNLGFDDVTVGAWYMPYLKTGYTYGLISGDAGKKTVRPADSVSRVEFLKFVYEAFAKVRGVDTAFCSSNPYSDVPLGAWYTNYSCQAKNDNLFDVSFGMFMPGKSATRGEVAEALYRLLK